VMHRNVTHNKCYATVAQFADATLGFLRENVPRNWATMCDSVNFRFFGRSTPEGVNSGSVFKWLRATPCETEQGKISPDQGLVGSDQGIVPLAPAAPGRADGGPTGDGGPTAGERGAARVRAIHEPILDPSHLGTFRELFVHCVSFVL
jgi:hypothetical protein